MSFNLHKEFVALFSPAVCNILLHGKKVSNSDFINLYNKTMELTQDKPVGPITRQITTNNHHDEQDDDDAMDEDIDSCTLLNQLIHEEILKVLHQLEDLKLVNSVDQLVKLWNDRIKALDSFLRRLFKGRNYFMNKFPMAVVLGSQLFEDICRQMFNSEEVTMTMESSCQHNMCYKEEAPSNVTLSTTINTDSLKELFNTMEEYYKEKTAREVVKYTLHQTPIPRHKFTRTKNLLHNIDGDMGIKFANVDGSRLNRVDIPLSKECCQFGDPIAFYIDDVLTPEECSAIIEKTEAIGFRTLEHEFLSYERDNDRALLIFPYFADLIWNRVRPIFEKDEKLWSQQRPFGWHNEGTWNPSSINNCMRCCRYNGPCVGFVPHRDGNFVQSVDERSKFTMIIYLNDEFEDGTTDFLRAHQPATMGELVKEELERGYSHEFSLKPKKGRVLIFDHALLHQGRPIPSSHKYIIRTDIVLKRVDNPQPDMSYLQDPEYHKMLYLYKAAANYECHGFVETSSELYERALSLRMHYPRRKNQE